MRLDLEGCFSAFVILTLILMLVSLCAVISYSAVINIPTQQVVITVDHKESIASGSGYSYLVWTKEGETFEIRDNIFHGRFDSSDFYNKLKEGNTYCVVVTGKRIHVLSWYRNILGFCEYNVGGN